MKILAIDDEQSNLLLIETMLMDYDIELDSFLNPEQALTHLKDHPDYELILVDKMMPEMDGTEFINRVRAVDTIAGIPIVVQSASALPEQIELVMDEGADYYLVKPFTKVQLITAIQQSTRSKT